jgi:formate hydrogenlyase subunit 4
MIFSAAFSLRSNLGYVAAHASLLAGMVGLLFLQQYIWIMNIAERGYGPYQSASYLVGVSAVVVLIDLFVLRSFWKGSRLDRVASLLWPGFFVGVALLILVLNNA